MKLASGFIKPTLIIIKCVLFMKTHINKIFKIEN